MTKKIVVDLARCTGCRLCELVCSLRKEGSFNYHKARVRLTHVTELGLDVPIVCELCEKPPCMIICPTEALSKHTETGAMVVNEKKCIGCGMCVDYCPSGAIVLDPSRKTAVLCDHCAGDPLCTKYCSTQAIRYENPQTAAQVKREKQIAKVSRNKT